MLSELFPKAHGRLRSLPILGFAVDRFVGWLSHGGYPRPCLLRHARTVRRVDLALHARGVRQLAAATREDLRACLPTASQNDPQLAATLRCLERFLTEAGLLAVLPEQPSQSQSLLSTYRDYLGQVRGLAMSTISNHLQTAAELLAHIGYEVTVSRLGDLSTSDLEDFLRVVGARQGRSSLQHVVAHLRSFLRFLAGRGDLRQGLDIEIDTPRVYRLEQLPRALPWETVRAFLRSIDRRTQPGVRDYAIFLLIATYGLRASEIVALTLDDIEWRSGRIDILQRKGRHRLLLPLTDDVGASLVEYLRRGRPSLPYREVFLRCKAPAGVLKPTAVTEAFQGWVRRSGLKIPFQGAHCLRHSYAVHLLRQGVSLKTIGDVLGHRSADATCIYLRLSVEDLRDVALSLPREELSQGVRP
ncbi:MAG TPA: site-specific integrase [Myxococcota bacterium]|nr:site-specific integrase [Myxococcota bacterium]